MVAQSNCQIAKAKSTRPYKSRSQRPCDFCRRRKTCCIIEGTIPCTPCVQFNQGKCTFLEGPMKRNNKNETKNIIKNGSKSMTSSPLKQEKKSLKAINKSNNKDPDSQTLIALPSEPEKNEAVPIRDQLLQRKLHVQYTKSSNEFTVSNSKRPAISDMQEETLYLGNATLLKYQTDAASQVEFDYHGNDNTNHEKATGHINNGNKMTFNDLKNLLSKNEELIRSYHLQQQQQLQLLNSTLSNNLNNSVFKSSLGIASENSGLEKSMEYYTPSSKYTPSSSNHGSISNMNAHFQHNDIHSNQHYNNLELLAKQDNNDLFPVLYTPNLDMLEVMASELGITTTEELPSNRTLTERSLSYNRNNHSPLLDPEFLLSISSANISPNYDVKPTYGFNYTNLQLFNDPFPTQPYNTMLPGDGGYVKITNLDPITSDDQLNPILSSQEESDFYTPLIL